MRILFVFSAAEFSTKDVAEGYYAALEAQGHELRAYRLYLHVGYHAKALGEKRSQNRELLSKQATEAVLAEALKHQADLVFITSGLSFHPNGLWLLKEAQIPACVIFTESPYDDEKQLEWASVYPEMRCFTNEQISAERYGWGFLPPAYNPAVHKPGRPFAEDECDVLIVGTGWPERQRMLEAVDWTGINLRIRGLWDGIKEDSPLFPCYAPGCVDNSFIPELYASAKICINHHRFHPDAKTPNPRAFEIAACGAFQLSDRRAGLDEIFGITVPLYEGAEDLSAKIRYYLERTKVRQELAERARRCVAPHTFEARTKELVKSLKREPVAAAVS